jgi:ribonucleoside-diphosphate reductase alpha chain
MEFSEHAKSLLTDYYMKEGDHTPLDSFERACTLYTSNKDLSQRLLEYVQKGWFMFSSPILSNSDGKGLPISCFLTFVPDSVEGLISHTDELRWMSVMGGGVGGHWSSVRSVSEKSPGPIPFLKTVDSDMGAYKQGSTRKGSYAAYLDISHPDIVEFLNIRVPTGGDTNRKCFTLNNAINITDKFMEAVFKGESWDLVDPKSKEVRDTLDARSLWQRILEVRFRTGEPYLNFIDTANRHLPQPLKDKGLEIHGSNLCVRGDTQVLTRKGYFSISSLEGQEVDVWNGVEWSTTTVVKTGEDQEILEVVLDNGTTLYTTPYHKFYDHKGSMLEARDLTESTALLKFDLPVVEGEGEWQNAYACGFFTGDGTYNHLQQPLSYLYGQKKSLLEKLNTPFCRVWAGSKSDRYSVIYDRSEIKPKYEVPLGMSLKTRLEWLSGFLDADGCVARNGKNQSLQVASVEREFLTQLSLMLNTLGVQPKISEFMPERVVDFGAERGGEYECRKAWRILINSNDTQKLLDLGLNTHRLVLRKHEPQRSASRFVRVARVSKSESADTYCFNEPKRHMGVFNGVLTGNCNEIHLPTAKDRSAVCCLSSLNLEYFDDWKDTTIVEDLIEFLDDVLQYFIDHAPSALSRAIYSAMRERSLGLGAMGFHSYLQRNMISFESMWATIANKKIFSLIKERALSSSRRLAQLKGEYPDGTGSGLRNSHLLAVAPNANSAIILDTSPSIEPWKSNAFTHRTRAGSFLQVNKYLLEILKSRVSEGLDDVVQSVILNQGSVQHLDVLTAHEKEVFKTAFELDQMWVIEHASERQEWICQGQSVNLFFPAGSNVNYVNAVHLSAYKKGLKGLYYLRTTAGVVADKVSEKIERKALKDYKIEECLSCQG